MLLSIFYANSDVGVYSELIMKISRLNIVWTWRVHIARCLRCCAIFSFRFSFLTTKIMRRRAVGRRKRLLMLALVFLQLAEEEYKLIGLMFVSYAYTIPTAISRGPYNVKKSQEVLMNILNEDSEKYFKAHLRFVRNTMAYCCCSILLQNVTTQFFSSCRLN